MTADSSSIPTDYLRLKDWLEEHMARSPGFAWRVLTDRGLRLPHREAAKELAAKFLGRRADPQDVARAVELLLANGPYGSPYLVMALGLARDPAAVGVLADQLAEAIRRGRDCSERALALSRIGTGDAVAALLRGAQLCDPDSVPEELVRALCRIGGRSVADHVVEWSARAPRMWESATLSLVAGLADPRLTPFLVEVCAGPHRRIGLKGLRRCATPRAVPALVHMFLTAADRQERRLAGEALARNTDGDGLIMLLHAAKPEVEVRRDYAWLLGRVVVPTHRAATLAARLTKDADPLVRAQAVRSVGQLGHDPAGLAPRYRDPARVFVLGPLLDDDSYRVRAAAATAAARIEDLGALPRLAELASADEVACVRDAAAAATRSLRALPESG